MSGSLSRSEFERLLQRLSQGDTSNLRVGSTTPFPSLEEFKKLKKIGNCSTRFSKVYQIPIFLADAGASGGKIYLLEAVGERKRLDRLHDVVNKLPLIVKKSKLGLDTDEENFMDLVIGSRLNILVASKIAPGFMRTVDWFICHDLIEKKATPNLYSIIERQDTNIVNFMLGGIANLPLIRSIFAQLLFTLESAQEAMGYVHYDMHSGNVFVRVARNKEQLGADFWSFVRANGETLWISADDTNRHEPIIIDFGRNRIQSPLFTKTGRMRTGRAAGTEVLVIDPAIFWNIGLTTNLHRQWDMRRLVGDLLETLLEENESESRARTKAMRQRSGRPDKGPAKDYFRRLRIQTTKSEYNQFINVLNEMSGHRHVKLRREVSRDKELLELWDQYFDLMKNDKKTPRSGLGTSQVDDILDEYRDGGIRQLIKWLRAEEDTSLQLDVVLIMWSWTAFTFDATPGTVLSMPFFDTLYKPPKARGLQFAEVARFRPLVDLEEGTLVECARDNCSEIATHRCVCELLNYCSDSCADADWDDHGEHCTHT